MSVPLRTLDHPQSQRAPRQQSGLFQYQILESQNTFRLLKLHAGHGDRIDCSLHHYTLGSGTCPSYRAVSYTWGDDAARFKIHLSRNSIINVRENLRNALRSVRDNESDCWLWIDAICIDQRSDTDKNHQLRLMADIYGNANVVLVWLQSASESANVARAFKFVHAAATYHNSEHSVYHYLRAHSSDSHRKWHSMQNLCKLRYWTRKWIIQELITARTAVLQVGDSKCSMTDLETFCRQLHQNRHNQAYKNLVTARREIWDFVVASPAGRLALQRSETSHEQQPRLLYELVEHYATNECHMPCDHVYALYSLVGEHRRHMTIDYAASPVQRLVAVLHFVRTHERIPASEVLRFANLLVRLFKIQQEELLQERRLLKSLTLVVLATLLGTVELQPESERSIALRRTVKSLHPMPTFSIDTSQNVWALTANEDLGDPWERVGRPDMSYFSIANSGFYGLAACRLEQGDTIWHFPETQLVFAIRQLHGHGALVVGRAYLFSAASNPDALEHWHNRAFDYNTVRQGERHLAMNLATLFEMSSLAIPAKIETMDLKMNVKTNWLVNDIKAAWKKWRPYIVVIAGSSKSIYYSQEENCSWIH